MVKFLNQDIIEQFLEHSVANLIEIMLKDDNNRIICGDVLSGTKIDKNGYLGFYDTQLTRY